MRSRTAEKNERGTYDPYKAYRTVTFITTDTPERVFAFYKEALKQSTFEDWRVASPELEIGSQVSILRIYGFLPEITVSPPMYVFQVKAEQKDGLTHVTVERSYVPGM